MSVSILSGRKSQLESSSTLSTNVSAGGKLYKDSSRRLSRKSQSLGEYHSNLESLPTGVSSYSTTESHSIQGRLAQVEFPSEEVILKSSTSIPSAGSSDFSVITDGSSDTATLTGSSVTSTTGCKEPFLVTTERLTALTNTTSTSGDSSLTANSIQREANSLTVPTTLEGTAHSTLLPNSLEGSLLTPSCQGSSLTPLQREPALTRQYMATVPLSVSPPTPLCVLPLPAVFQSVQPYLGPAWTSGPWLYWTLPCTLQI